MSEWKQIAPGVKTRQVEHITKPGDIVVTKPKPKKEVAAKKEGVSDEKANVKKTSLQKKSNG